jgi:glyoxylase-like metal-dependent hydrolase (beta-lactamase superfamily II)
MLRFIAGRRAALAGFTAIALAFAAAAVHAEAPPQKTQVAGWYRHNVGAFEVTALHDGVIEIDSKQLRNADPKQVQVLLARMFRADPTPTAVNGYLVNMNGKLVLVDTGAAKAFGPALGQVADNLRAAGYQPEQVDAVLITHLHGDHVAGILGADGARLFPNATLHFHARDAAFWLSKEVMARAPQEAQGFFKVAQDAVAPYQAAGKVKTFEGDGAEILPGVKAVATHGHTPGHTSFLLESNGQKLFVLGDLVHNAAVQFPNPKVAIEFDIDTKAAVATRQKVFARLAKDKLLVAGAHLPFPGLGRVRADGKGAYAWVPIDFGPLR